MKNSKQANRRRQNGLFRGAQKYLILVLCVSLVSVATGKEIGKNLRVVWSEDPQHAATVVWDGDTVDEGAVLLYGTAPGKCTVKAPLTEAGRYGSSKDAKKQSRGFSYHHAKLTNLQPDTIYYLTVQSPAGKSREYHFRTAPADEKVFKLVYAGDSLGHDTALGIAVQLREMMVEDGSIIALLHGGDYGNAPITSVWARWLASYAKTTTEAGRILPIIPIVGNHDKPAQSPIFRQAYGYPGGEKDYYACQLTPAVSIICLNTEISAEGEQKRFLEQALTRQEEKNVRWRMAAFHRPAYAAVKKPGPAKVSWVPLFEQFNIDLVLESDGHCIKRTFPIRADKEADDGIVYLGEGGFGAPQRNPQRGRWYLKGERAFVSKGDHIMMLEITPDSIHYETILNSGEIVDSASFKARR